MNWKKCDFIYDINKTYNKKSNTKLKNNKITEKCKKMVYKIYYIYIFNLRLKTGNGFYVSALTDSMKPLQNTFVPKIQYKQWKRLHYIFSVNDDVYLSVSV